MSLNILKKNSQMYNFITATWNPIKGKCPHECSYCYMTKMYKRYKWNPELRLDEKCFKDNLGEGNFIFVGSSTDMWAENIPREWIVKVMNYCVGYPSNKYLFQSKNPKRFMEFFFPNENCIVATTIETNRRHRIAEYSKVSDVFERCEAMRKINADKKMVTIEPIMDFNLDQLILLIQGIKPFQVNIGADSGHNNLPEPSSEKIQALITELEKFTKVYQKDNLKRLL